HNQHNDNDNHDISTDPDYDDNIYLPSRPPKKNYTKIFFGYFCRYASSACTCCLHTGVVMLGPILSTLAVTLISLIVYHYFVTILPNIIIKYDDNGPYPSIAI